MPNCPDCQKTCVHGEILCSNCGADLEPVLTEQPSRPTVFLPVVDVGRAVAIRMPHITLHIIQVDEEKFPEGAYVAIIPIERLGTPIRIGRRDTTKTPPIIPELDLGHFLQDIQPGVKPTVSRLHAALQLENGHPVIKAVTERSTTWVRHSASEQISPVPPNTIRRLEDRDVIILGFPHTRHVLLRVVFCAT